MAAARRAAVAACPAGRVAQLIGGARTVTVRVRSNSPSSYSRALDVFKKRVVNEGVEKEIQKHKFYTKPNIQRNLNAKNTRYFKARKAVVAEYMKLVKRGQVEKLPDTKF